MDNKHKSSSEVDLAEENRALRAEIARLGKIVEALMEQAERVTDAPHSAYGMFQATVMLEDQVRSRTHELEAALLRNEKISRELRTANESLRLAATVYNASNEAMMITDASNHIEATNPAFTRLTGYSAEEVIGKNPNILNSGHQDKGFYMEMWEALGQNHHWEGDVWNRRKNGDLYAQWLSISVVQDDQGKVQNYVALFSDITEKKKAEEQIWQHANYDALTKLPNRRLFRDRLEHGIKRAERSGETLALFFIDLDHFKEVNDTLGHQAGDTLLMQAAQRITACVRASDTVARLGGDEFTAILYNVNDRAQIERVAQSIVVAISREFLLGQQPVHVSASIGIMLYPADAKDIDALLNGADKAMYRSKVTGRNRFTYYASPAN